MLEILDKARCMGCHACYSVCPKECITMKSDNEGFLYPSIDNSLCINCGACERACPVINPKAITNDSTEAYAAKSNDEELRLKSSSGGIFTELAKVIVENGGVVFGAGFDKDFNVVHSSATSVEELEKFRGSKYVQSKIGNTYKETKALLENGKFVYFSGTPCQIGGLYSFLGKDYDNLVAQDLICHGVASPIVWNKYLEYLSEKADGARLKHFSFKNKKTGWETYSVFAEFENGRNYSLRSSEDLMMRLYLSNLCLRPSCYNCAFKRLERQNDITLADFWGVKNILPQMHDNKGTSLVVVHSQKGYSLLEKTLPRIVISKTDIQEAVKYNLSMIKSPSIPKKRNECISSIKLKDFEKATQHFCKPSFLTRLKRKIKKILKRK